MDGDLVNRTSIKRKGITDSLFPYTDLFYEHLPYYLSLGMSPDEYWHGDSALVRVYRQKREYEIEDFNQKAWVQGMYFYTALANVSPLFNSNAKKGTQAKPYPDKPYAITPRMQELEKEEQERKEFERKKAQFQARVTRINQNFEN